MDKNILAFPVADFTHNGHHIECELYSSELQHHDENDDWWDYWIYVGDYVYQICGDYEHPHRKLSGLVVYVYPKDCGFDDEDRIATITEVTIKYIE